MDLVNEKTEKYREFCEEIIDFFEKYVIFAKMKHYLLEKKYSSFHIVRVLQKNYYDLTLSERKVILNAPSEAHLCKSIIMENTVYNEEIKDSFYPKYICVIIQFVTKINAEKVMKLIKSIQNEKSLNKLGRNRFHFRLVDEKVPFFLIIL